MLPYLWSIFPLSHFNTIKRPISLKQRFYEIWLYYICVEFNHVFCAEFFDLMYLSIAGIQINYNKGSREIQL